MKKRFIAALRFSQLQFQAMILLTGYNLFACWIQENPSILCWVIAALFCPTFAWLLNFISPIPRKSLYDE